MGQDNPSDQGNDKIHGGSGRGDNKGDRADDKGASDSSKSLRGESPEKEPTDGGSRTEGQGSQGSSGNKTSGGGGPKH